MVFDGPDLICTGDNAVMRLRDTDGDDVADGAPQVWTNLRHPEHGANGIVRGPDGCYYVICGNDAGISEQQITSQGSPVKHPRCGGVVRLSAEGTPLDVLAHGFRNPYDLDFDAAGHLLTVDADGERDHHLPWYAPTRLFDVAQGMEHGWLLMGWTRGWNRPPSLPDNVERMVEIGRGSPTGLVVYRHRAFGPRYQGGVFSACWSMGRVYYLPLESAGATCRSKLETFVETTGDVGFAPCDLAVGPQGDLFIAIGGRRTRGSVFRVRPIAAANQQPAQPTPTALSAVLSAYQPLTSWSRARWRPLAEALGPAAFEQAAEDESLPLDERIRAIEIVVELCGGPELPWSERLSKSSVLQLRARIAWALSRAAHLADAQQMLARLTADADPAVQRAAWEALAMADRIDPQLPLQPDWTAGLTSRERRVRAAAILAATGAGAASYRLWTDGPSSAGTSPQQAWRCKLAALWIARPDDAELREPPFQVDDMSMCANAFRSAGTDTALALEAVRLLQIGLGDLRTRPGQAEVYSGYVGNLTQQWEPRALRSVAAQLAPTFPTSDAELNRELARLLGMLGAEHPALLPAIARQWTPESSVEDDIHYLIVASLLPGERDARTTTATARALAGLHAKLDVLEQFASRNWPLRVGETFDELCRRDPALAEALVACDTFGHGGHTLFAERLEPPLRQRATRTLWARCSERGDEPTSELVALVGRLPADEAHPLLVSQWEQAGLRDAIVLALARAPRDEDRAKFVEALASPQAIVVERAAQALLALGVRSHSHEMAAALRALKQACGAVKQPEPRRSLVRLLNFWTEENSEVEADPDPARVWMGWYRMFADYYPAAAAELERSTAADADAWKRRLAAVDWTTGDAARGRRVFELRACHRCHEQSGHLGPELKGAAARFSRDDLFTAIVDPNLEVAPTYQTTLIATHAGQVYHGLVVYESPEATLLQTGPDTTVRITNADQSSVRQSAQSLMPTGLLDTLDDQQLSDLYAYLRNLDVKQPQAGGN
jgi:putative heme-binding domain-containing protein